MPQKKHKPEEIVAKLRQVDVLVSQGQSVAETVRSISVTQLTYYRWRKEFGGLKTDQVKRLKELEKENERLRKAVSDLTLEKLILQEAIPSSPSAPHSRDDPSFHPGRPPTGKSIRPKRHLLNLDVALRSQWPVSLKAASGNF